MAVADGLVPSPPLPPPPASRNIAASLARCHLWRTAVMAGMYLFLACLWLLVAGGALSVIGRRACGEGCPVVAAAFKVRHAGGVTLVLVGPVAALLVVLRMAYSDTEVEEEPIQKSIAERVRELLRDTVLHGILASMAFLFLMLLGGLLRGFPPIKGSHRERVGSVISDVGALGMELLCCFIVFPILALRMWRMR